MRTVIIMRGLPGSGKSTVAKLFRDKAEAFIVSMDDFWTRDGKPYKFDKERINEAVQWTHDRFTQFIENDADLIIVDNTNTQQWEYKWFKTQAEEMGYIVHLLEVQRPILECHAACRHLVPFSKLFEMAERFERPAAAKLENYVYGLLETVASIQRKLATDDNSLHRIVGK